MAGLVIACVWVVGIMIWGVSQSTAQRERTSTANDRSCTGKASTAVLTAIQLVPYKLRAVDLDEVRTPPVLPFRLALTVPGL